MRFIKTYNSFNERLGINEILIEPAKKIKEFIKDNKFSSIDYPYIEDWMKVDKFEIEYNPKKSKLYDANMTVQNEFDDVVPTFTCKLIITDKNISISTLIHELQHLFEYIRRYDDKNSRFDMSSDRDYFYDTDFSYLLNKDIKLFGELIYFSQDDEINGRIQDTYFDIKELNDGKEMTKEDFIRDIKDSYLYEVSQLLQNNFLDDLIENPKKTKNFANQLLVIDKYQIWTGNHNKNVLDRIVDFYYKNIHSHLSKNITVEESVKSVKYFKKFFDKQGKKIERKLYKLYDLFEIK